MAAGVLENRGQKTGNHWDHSQNNVTKLVWEVLAVDSMLNTGCHNPFCHLQWALGAASAAAHGHNGLQGECP